MPLEYCLRARYGGARTPAARAARDAQLSAGDRRRGRVRRSRGHRAGTPPRPRASPRSASWVSREASAQVLALGLTESVQVVESLLGLALELIHLRLTLLELRFDARPVLEHHHDVRGRARHQDELLELFLAHSPYLVEPLLEPQLQVCGGLLGRRHDRRTPAEDDDRSAPLDLGNLAERARDVDLANDPFGLTQGRERHACRLGDLPHLIHAEEPLGVAGRLLEEIVADLAE